MVPFNPDILLSVWLILHSYVFVLLSHGTGKTGNVLFVMQSFEISMPYKRIVFPRNSNYKNALNKDYIYPRKSKLEEQLDMCFQAARMHFAMPQIYEFVDSLQIPISSNI
jgi:hypothetical protein